MDNKENKKLKNNQNIIDNRLARKPSISLDTFLNSTAKSQFDLTDAAQPPICPGDLSTITPFIGMGDHHHHHQQQQQQQQQLKKQQTPLADLVLANSADPNIKQIYIDCLYMNYLNVLNMNLTSRSAFKDEEELSMKDILELHKADEALKKQIIGLDYEEKLIINLSHLTKFIDLIDEFFANNEQNLSTFKSYMNSFVELCSEVRDYIEVKNVHFDRNKSFFDSLATELNKTIIIINQINSACENSKLIERANLELADQMIDYETLEKLMEKFVILKDLIEVYNGYEVINRLKSK